MKLSKFRIEEVKIKNYRSFGSEQIIKFPNCKYNKPVAIVGYNNVGKSNLINAILHTLKQKRINIHSISLDDFHNREIENKPFVSVKTCISNEEDKNGKEITCSGFHKLLVETEDDVISSVKVEIEDNKGDNIYGLNINDHYNIYYINFHDIKREISAKKTSWGNVTTFLGKHIKYLLQKNVVKREEHEEYIKNLNSVLEEVSQKSGISDFFDSVQQNYKRNLRNNNLKIEFAFPEYEDIFLEVIFKAAINKEFTEDLSNLLPIENFGDGYISMFIMAIIQAIAESEKDKCLFIMEEPESYLHENHQAYFYKMVLKKLALNGHQVIYTTHSQEMIDIFDTRGLIRLGMYHNETVVEYNNSEGTIEVVDEIRDYNNYTKIIEPNINKIVFCNKVIFVEGPNDLMVYSEAVRRKVQEVNDDESYAKAYLNYKNISIIPHHSKANAVMLAKLCKHINVNYFLINDLDFESNIIDDLDFKSKEELEQSEIYNEKIKELQSLKPNKEDRDERTKKGMLTTNWKIINSTKNEKMHFNIPKLEKVIHYKHEDKDSLKIWNHIKNIDLDNEELFPEKLLEFLEIK